MHVPSFNSDLWSNFDFRKESDEQSRSEGSKLTDADEIPPSPSAVKFRREETPIDRSIDRCASRFAVVRVRVFRFVARKERKKKKKSSTNRKPRSTFIRFDNQLALRRLDARGALSKNVRGRGRGGGGGNPPYIASHYQTAALSPLLAFRLKSGRRDDAMLNTFRSPPIIAGGGGGGDFHGIIVPRFAFIARWTRPARIKYSQTGGEGRAGRGRV